MFANVFLYRPYGAFIDCLFHYYHFAPMGLHSFSYYNFYLLFGLLSFCPYGAFIDCLFRYYHFAPMGLHLFSYYNFYLLFGLLSFCPYGAFIDCLFHYYHFAPTGLLLIVYFVIIILPRWGCIHFHTTIFIYCSVGLFLKGATISKNYRKNTHREMSVNG